MKNPSHAGQIFLLLCWCFSFDPPNSKPDRIILLAEDTKYGVASQVIVLSGTVGKCGPGSIVSLIGLRGLSLFEVGSLDVPYTLR
jgi:hypothetical protein